MANNDTQKILLDTATELFYRKGYAGTSIREVGVNAKMANSLLYHYFKNKEEILFTIVSNTSQDLIKTLQEIDEKITDPLECIKEMLYQHIVVFGLERKKQSKIVVDEKYWLTGKRKEAVRVFERQIYEIYLKKLKQLSETGRINDINITVLNFSIFGTINWFYKWYREGSELSPQDVADNILRLLLHGILKS